VDSLLTAEVRSVPQVVERLGADRSLVRDRLYGLVKSSPSSSGRIGAALALLPYDRSQASHLVDDATKPEATPEELLVIRAGLLRNHALDAFVDPLTARLPAAHERLSEAAMRALGLLADARPDWKRWPEFADQLAARLVQVNPFEIAPWREVFQPVSAVLTKPMSVIYSDRSERQPRALAFSLLLEFASQHDNRERPEALAALLPDADPDQLRSILRRLLSPADRERALAAILPLIGVPAQGDLARAERQARLAPVLCEFSRAELVWPMLTHRDDPSLRTEVVHIMADYEVDPNLLCERLKVDSNRGVRRNLILALGGFALERIAPERRGDLKVLLLSWYGSDPDPGIHSALDWTLRQGWDAAGELSAIDRGLCNPGVPSDRDWFINASGQTFAIVRGPVSFPMGTVPGTDRYAGADERPEERTIPRSFAIATREVSLADFRLFVKDEAHDLAPLFDSSAIRMRIPSDDCAAGALCWYDAARYCNWLSKREKIPEDQWCYPQLMGHGMTLPRNSLERTGYRLPTEAEWEFACRAGTKTLWPHGLSESRLTSFAWIVRDAGRVMHPSGQKRPNELGLFDMLGNASEWTTSTVEKSWDSNRPLLRDDVLERLVVEDTVFIDSRGGSFLDPSADVRSANRSLKRPNERLPILGMRLARTCPK
jgi:formylglycine-generating enzyme required for sulfatase activity